MQKWFKSRSGGGEGGNGRAPPMGLGNSLKGRASLRDTQAALATALETLSVKDNAIKQLEDELREKEATIATLNTQLDKLRSVLPPLTGRANSLHGRISLRSLTCRNNNNEHHNRNSLQNDRFYTPPSSYAGICEGVCEGAEARVKRTAISAEPAAQDFEEFYDPDYAPMVIPKSEK
ncbi:uncharacterized protein LOC121874459 [Homarus americanus]|uniref:uncharacterized protein LOC121874459 n=1 Tax=Homarus americanus TaxID=6706 RepID=UPI001C44B7D3|nr:uncharacterized protein LOC121874459 [Homarus americanus]